MKRNFIIVAAVAGLLALATMAFAIGGKLPYDKSTPPVPIQNLKGTAPAKGKSGCVTQAMTKGTFGVYTTISGYTGYSGEVVTAAGAAEPVKWELDGTQVATGSSFEFINEGAATYSRVTQRVYSAASRNLTSCNRRQQ